MDVVFRDGVLENFHDGNIELVNYFPKESLVWDAYLGVYDVSYKIFDRYIRTHDVPCEYRGIQFSRIRLYTQIVSSDIIAYEHLRHGSQVLKKITAVKEEVDLDSLTGIWRPKEDLTPRGQVRFRPLNILLLIDSSTLCRTLSFSVRSFTR